jgi:nucleoside-diphosphate-sugar epimerase
MKVDVIGGSGFIGTRLCQRFHKVSDITFTILDKSPSRAYSEHVSIADVRSVDVLRRYVSDGAVIQI